MANSNFELDTKNFDTAARQCEKLAQLLADSKREIDNCSTKLADVWQGEGYKMFQKRYHVLSQRLYDLSESLHDIAETIYDSESSYIQADVNYAKEKSGVEKYE